MKIAIGIPSRGDWRQLFGVALSRMLVHTARERPDLEIEIVASVSTSISRNRLTIARMALDAGAEFLLWLDDDQFFPPDLLLRLLVHQREIVGAAYPYRGNCDALVAFDTDRNQLTPSALRCAGSELVQAGFIGMGLLLTRLDAIKPILPDCFEQPYEGSGIYCTEDASFCRKLTAAGVQIWIDPKLSLQCGHIGDVIFESLGRQRSVTQRSEPWPWGVRPMQMW